MADVDKTMLGSARKVLNVYYYVPQRKTIHYIISDWICQIVSMGVKKQVFQF